MKNLTSTLGRLSVALASALALGSCNRAEYAILPRSASYQSSTTVATAPRPVATPAPAAAPVLTEAVVTLPAVPVATATKASLAAAPAPAAPVVAPPPAAPKLSLVQRLALAKITKKLDKLAAKSPQFKQRSAVAARGGLDENLRTGLLFVVAAILVGLIASLLSSGFLAIIATILFIIGLVFGFFYLVDHV